MMRGPLSRSFFIILQVSLWNLFEVKTMLPKFCLRISINHRTMHWPEKSELTLFISTGSNISVLILKLMLL